MYVVVIVTIVVMVHAHILAHQIVQKAEKVAVKDAQAGVVVIAIQYVETAVVMDVHLLAVQVVALLAAALVIMIVV